MTINNHYDNFYNYDRKKETIVRQKKEKNLKSKIKLYCYTLD